MGTEDAYIENKSNNGNTYNGIQNGLVLKIDFCGHENKGIGPVSDFHKFNWKVLPVAIFLGEKKVISKDFK